MAENEINDAVERIKEAEETAGEQFYKNYYSCHFMLGNCCPGMVGDIRTPAEALANLS